MPLSLHAVVIKNQNLNEAKQTASEYIKNGHKTFYTENTRGYRFRCIPKTKFVKGTFKSKKINKDITLVFGQLNTEHGHLHGKGLVDDTISAVKNAYKTVANRFSIKLDYNNKCTAVLKKVGECKIVGIQIYRQPVQSWIEKTLTTISLGQFRTMYKEKYDDIFHLATLLTLDNGQNLLIEKNETINMVLDQNNPNPNRETLEVIMNLPTRGQLRKPTPTKTLNEFLQNARTFANNDNTYFTYDPLSNNCQCFIMLLMDANNITTPTIKNFVYQSMDKIIKEMPIFHRFAKGVTDLGAVVNNLTGGEEYYTPHDIIKGGRKSKSKKHHTDDIFFLNEDSPYRYPTKDEYEHIYNHLNVIETGKFKGGKKPMQLDDNIILHTEHLHHALQHSVKHTPKYNYTLTDVLKKKHLVGGGMITDKHWSESDFDSYMQIFQMQSNTFRMVILAYEDKPITTAIASSLNVLVKGLLTMRGQIFDHIKLMASSSNNPDMQLAYAKGCDIMMDFKIGFVAPSVFDDTKDKSQAFIQQVQKTYKTAENGGNALYKAVSGISNAGTNLANLSSKLADAKSTIASTVATVTEIGAVANSARLTAIATNAGQRASKVVDIMYKGTMWASDKLAVALGTTIGQKLMASSKTVLDIIDAPMSQAIGKIPIAGIIAMFSASYQIANGEFIKKKFSNYGNMLMGGVRAGLCIALQNSGVGMIVALAINGLIRLCNPAPEFQPNGNYWAHHFLIAPEFQPCWAYACINWDGSSRNYWFRYYRIAQGRKYRGTTYQWLFDVNPCSISYGLGLIALNEDNLQFQTVYKYIRDGIMNKQTLANTVNTFNLLSPTVKCTFPSDARENDFSLFSLWKSGLIKKYDTSNFSEYTWNDNDPASLTGWNNKFKVKDMNGVEMYSTIYKDIFYDVQYKTCQGSAIEKNFNIAIPKPLDMWFHIGFNITKQYKVDVQTWKNHMSDMGLPTTINSLEDLNGTNMNYAGEVADIPETVMTGKGHKKLKVILNKTLKLLH